MSWELKKLGDVCEIINGNTPLKSNKSFWENGTINWFSIDDFRKQGKFIEVTEKKVTTHAKVRVLPKNTVILCCTASIGEVAITSNPMATNQQFNGLLIKNKDELNYEYLYYFCLTLKKQLLELSSTTTISFLSSSKLKQLKLPIPPLSEQKRIVAKLDKAFAEIDKAFASMKKIENNYLQLKSAILKKELQSEAA